MWKVNPILHQTTYAYNSLAKADKPALFMESMEFIAGYLKEKDPEGLIAIPHG